MKLSNPSIRSLLILALMIGIVCLSPAVSAMALRSGAVSSDVSSQKQCCCGTATGKCCGKGCCGADAPKQQRTPMPHQDRNEHSGSQVLTCYIVKLELPAAGSLRRRGAETESAVAGFRRHTLQALHVLLQT